MTTQDKPAVGPLSAESVKLLVKGDLLRCDRWNGEMFTAGREYAVVSIDADGDPVLISDEGESVPVCLIHQFTFVRRPAPTAPADVSTKPLETNTSAGRVKEAAKNEHVTAPVKAGGSEREDRTSRQWADRCVAKRVAGDLLAKANRTAAKDPMRTETVAGLLEDAEALMRLSALRPQPSGETREAVAARIRRLVGLADADFSFVAREAYVSKETDAILALIRPAAPDAGGGALADIAAERRRQIDVEGWTPEHDDEHANGELATAAACYAASGAVTFPWAPRFRGRHLVWPWSREWWKPRGRRSDLVRAGALIVAEIERLDRSALQPGGER